MRRQLLMLREAGPADAVRMISRKYVHRRVDMGRYGVRAGASRVPGRPCELPIEIWGPDRFDEVAGTNPYLHRDDLEEFRTQRSSVIVTIDDGRLAASTWMTAGRVRVSELERSLDVPDDEHFSCRSYVDPAYRGLSLMSHMIHAYSAAQRPEDEVWGLVYDWNLSSIRSLERIGWRRSGDYWTQVTLGRRTDGERRYRPQVQVFAPR